jgi:hypothetical protein
MGVRLRWLIWYFYAAGTTAWCMRRVLASTGVLMGPSTSAYPMEQSSHPALICVSAGTSWPGVRNKEADLNITSDTLIPKWYGEKMDHQMAVLGLLQRE